MKIRKVTSKLREFHLSLLGKDWHFPRTISERSWRNLDPYLAFDNHKTTTVSECIARLAQINRVKHCLDKNTLLTLMHASVFSKMYYCSNVWANIKKKNVRKLQAVQNFACRIVSGAKKYDHVTPLLKSLSWPPVLTIAKLLWPSNAWPVTPLNILHPNLLPVSKLANEQLGVAKS